MNGVYVFLGPSLPLQEARAILPGAIYLPPAAMGDVQRLLRKRPTIIGIIDGLFEQVPSVWHKEILCAIEQGVRVFGASSMGALRAAELAPFGMEGVGRIFEAYRSGELEDDDEVAVAHASAGDGYRALSEPMVNVRDALARAARDGVITSGTHTRLLTIAKSTFYPERSWAELHERAAAAGIAAAELDALLEFVRRERPNLKRDDAVALLERLRDAALLAAPAPAPGFRLERTKFWLQLVETTEAGDDAPDVATAALRDHLRVAARDWRDLQCGALLLHLCAREAARLGLALDPQRFEAAATRFRARRELFSGAEARAWATDNAASRQEFARLVELEWQLEALLDHHTNEVDALLPTELRRRGQFGEVRREVVRKKRFLRESGFENPTFADAGDEAAPVFDWYQKRVRRIQGSLEDHARELGFDSLRLFLTELLEQFIYYEKARPEEAHAE